MIQPPAGLRLPLVHHFVEQGLGDPLPPVPPEMPAGDHDLVQPGRREPELAQPPAHSAGERHADPPQPIPEMLPVESLVQLVKPREDPLVTGGRTGRRTGGPRRIVVDRERRQDPLGRRIRQGGRTSEQPWLTIVGIVPTIFTGDPEEPREPAFYVPLAQRHSSFVSLAVRTAGPPMAITPQVRSAVAALNPDIPIYFVYSMQEAFERPTWFIRVFGTMFMIFGLIALFLASVGLYAVMSFSVSRRVREVGIRMALGAQGRDVERMIFRQGAWQLGLGLVLGLGLAATVAQSMQVILFDVQPRDPATFGSVVLVLAVAGLTACMVPARRATRVDPLVALRTD